MPLAPVIALSHGGGPMPLLGDPSHASITSSLRTRVPSLLGLNSALPPRAIVVVTAHWRTRHPVVSSGPSPSLLYDYYNFPPAAYDLTYPARGEPSVAEAVAQALRAEGLEATTTDDERGWDHGVFVPMLLIDPEGRVPVVQVSVLEDDDAARHVRMGRALRRLREDNIAVVGSGFASLHNFTGFAALAAGGGEGERWARMVREWNAALEGAVRGGELEGWRGLPHAWEMHPEGKGEHFMPLVVCAGAAGEGEAPGVYEDEYRGAQMKTFYWGAEL